PRLTPELLLRAYAEGLFPMAERRDDPDLFWVSPEKRGVIPLNRFHVPRRLARTVRSDRFEVRLDSAFAVVMTACGGTRPETWINAEILRLYGALHASGYAHSVECWRDGKLAGGLYGVSLGGAFFGESMFSRERDASKVALVHLAAQFGAVEISRAAYLARLNEALNRPGYWPAPSGSSTDFSVSDASGETGLTG